MENCQCLVHVYSYRIVLLQMFLRYNFPFGILHALLFQRHRNCTLPCLLPFPIFWIQYYNKGCFPNVKVNVWLYSNRTEWGTSISIFILLLFSKTSSTPSLNSLLPAKYCNSHKLSFNEHQRVKNKNIYFESSFSHVVIGNHKSTITKMHIIYFHPEKNSADQWV